MPRRPFALVHLKDDPVLLRPCTRGSDNSMRRDLVWLLAIVIGLALGVLLAPPRPGPVSSEAAPSHQGPAPSEAAPSHQGPAPSEAASPRQAPPSSRATSPARATREPVGAASTQSSARNPRRRRPGIRATLHALGAVVHQPGQSFDGPQQPHLVLARRSVLPRPQPWSSRGDDALPDRGDPGSWSSSQAALTCRSTANTPAWSTSTPPGPACTCETRSGFTPGPRGEAGDVSRLRVPLQTPPTGAG